MKSFTDQAGTPWSFNDSDSQASIDAFALAQGVTLTPISPEEFSTLTNPPPTLADVKAAKLRELAVAFAAVVNGDVLYNGVVYQGNPRALEALLSRLRLAEDPPYWRAKNNRNTSPFTLADVAALRLMIEQRNAAAVENLHAKKDAVLAADSIAAVKAVGW